MPFHHKTASHILTHVAVTVAREKLSLLIASGLER